MLYKGTTPICPIVTVESNPPVVETLTVTPSTTAQTITPPSGTDGYNTVIASAVTASIDSDIVAGNIKSGVNILGVSGTVTELVGTTTTITQNGTYAPTSPSNGFTSVSVNVAGTQPSGTYTITVNGTYDVTNYANANVNVSGGGGGIGITREVSANGVYQMPASSFTFSLPSNATDVGIYAMSYAFQSCTGLTSVDLSSLTTVSGARAMYYAFNGCTGLTSVDLSSLTTVSGANAMSYAFQSCTGLTSVDLSSLTTVSGARAMSYAFNGCTGLTSVDLSSLTTVSGDSAMYYAFNSCTGLTSANFNNLQTIGADSSGTDYGQFTNCFNNCNNLTSITFPKLEKIYCTGGTTKNYGTFSGNNMVQKLYFPKLDTITYGTGASTTNQNACKNVFYGCTSLTELHFAAANQSAIEASPGYSTAWGRGAGNVTIYFDL